MTEQIKPETIVTIINELKDRSFEYADKFKVPMNNRGRVAIAKNNAFIIGVRHGISIALDRILDNMPEELGLESHRILEIEDEMLDKKEPPENNLLIPEPETPSQDVNS